MPEEKETQPQIQEVVINKELINHKLNMIAEMVNNLEIKVDKLSKKL